MRNFSEICININTKIKILSIYFPLNYKFEAYDRTYLCVSYVYTYIYVCVSWKLYLAIYIIMIYIMIQHS